MVLVLKEALGDWYPVLQTFLQSQEGRLLGERLAKDEQLLQPILPNIFRALKLVPPNKVRVVILGQDPYPNGHADGLAFSSKLSSVPYSLKVIMKSLNEALYYRTRLSLEDWAEQGVLLLNSALTTIKGQVDAHVNIGWRPFIDLVLEKVLENRVLVFMAWGTPAKQRITGLDIKTEHLILQTNHPAAVRHGYLFKGADHFKMANSWLASMGEKTINWGDPLP